MGFWFTLILWAATFALNELIKPDDDEEDGNPGDDLDEPTTKEDRRVPLLFGRMKIDSPNCLFMSTPFTRAIKQDKGAIESLLTGEAEVIGQQFYVGLHLGWCYGGDTPVEDVTRLWWNKDDLFYDSITNPIEEPVINSASPSFQKTDLSFFAGSPGGHESTVDGYALGWDWKLGSTTQTAFSYYTVGGEQTINGQVPTYPGICMSMNTTFTVRSTEGYVGNSGKVPPISAEMARFPNGIGLTGDMHKVNGDDANPSAIIYEILTDTDWGRSIPTGDMDTASFVAAGTALFTEGTGYTNLIDTKTDTLDLLRAIEQHIDGVVFRNQAVGLWQIKLFRDDYVLGDQLEVNEDNIIELVTFTRGTWEGTTNQVVVRFRDRDDNYKDAMAFAQDAANEFISEQVVSSEKVFNGCKNKTLANKLAWRSLRTLSFPLAQGQLIMDRTAAGVLPGDVLSFSNVELGIVDMPIRVKRIELGDILDGRISIDFSEDVFYDIPATFADPSDTTWTEPDITDLDYIPAAEQLIIEAPRAFNIRDASLTDGASRVYVSARRQGFESIVNGDQATSTDGATEGAYAEDVVGLVSFAFIGQLGEALDPGGVYTGTLPTIQVDAGSSTALDIEGSFVSIANPNDLGTQLRQLCYIDGTNGGEFILVSSSGPGVGGDVTLNDVYRGVLDSVQQRHELADPVWLIFLGGSLALSEVVSGEYSHVRLAAAAFFGTLDPQNVAVTEAITLMTDRAKRPIPPSEYDVNTVRYPSSVAFGAYLTEASDLDFEITRRDYRQINEVEALTVDAGTASVDYPSANTTTHTVSITDLASVPYIQGSFGSGVTVSITQLDFVEALNNTAYPANVRIEISALHTAEGIGQIASRDNTYRQTGLSSPLIGTFTFGARTTNVASNSYTVTSGDAAAGFDVTISSAHTVGNIEYELNGSTTWVPVVTAPATTGAILAAALSASDTIAFRTTATETHQKGMELTQTGPNTLLGYGLFRA